jgi:hypothetical protein
MLSDESEAVRSNSGERREGDSAGANLRFYRVRSNEPELSAVQPSTVEGPLRSDRKAHVGKVACQC